MYMYMFKDNVCVYIYIILIILLLILNRYLSLLSILKEVENARIVDTQ